MAHETSVAEGWRRCAHALIHTLGATAVRLQLPAPPIANDSGEELGLRAPEFQWKPLVPVALRRSGKGVDLLVPADALEDLLGVDGSRAVAEAVHSLCAVVAGDETFIPTATEAVRSNGREYMYRIALRPNHAEVV